MVCRSRCKWQSRPHAGRAAQRSGLQDLSEPRLGHPTAIDQYSQYSIVDDIKINGKLTNGEDIADLGGLILAWIAWKAEIADKSLEPRDGFSPEQRFFIGYAQWACENDRPENLRVKALTDPHSPGVYRVNGLVVNMPEFERAFSCKAGQPMVGEKRCRVW
jgi:putative endopeptidase